MAVFEKQHSRLIFNSSPRSVWKRQFRPWNKRTGWISRAWLLDVFLEVLYGSLWAWFFGWPRVSWKELLHHCKVKNNIGDKGWIILLCADAREQSVMASELLQSRVRNGSLDILIIPDLSPPAQRSMSVFRNIWQDFCCWACLRGSCLAERGPVAACVQQAWRGSANIAGLGMMRKHLKQTAIWICFCCCFH